MSNQIIPDPHEMAEIFLQFFNSTFSPALSHEVISYQESETGNKCEAHSQRAK